MGVELEKMGQICADEMEPNILFTYLSHFDGFGQFEHLPEKCLLVIIQHSENYNYFYSKYLTCMNTLYNLSFSSQPLHSYSKPNLS